MCVSVCMLVNWREQKCSMKAYWTGMGEATDLGRPVTSLPVISPQSCPQGREEGHIDRYTDSPSVSRVHT